MKIGCFPLLIASFLEAALAVHAEPSGAPGPIKDLGTPTPFSVPNKKSVKPRNRNKIVRNKPTKTATPLPTPTVTSTPEPTPVSDDPQAATPTLSGPTQDLGDLAQVSILSDPVRGKKAIFRVVAKGKAKALVRIYDRTYTKVAELEGQGEDLFDILWTLKKVPEGIYHFQSQVILATGDVVTPGIQNFTVEKDMETPVEP